MRRAAFSFPRAATTVYHGGAMAPARTQALILSATLLSLVLAPAPVLADAPTAGPAAAPPPGGQPAPGGVIEVDQSGSDEQAKAHFRVGKSLYDSGRFAEAAAEWQKAYDMSKRPELLYNIYVAHRDANDASAATAALRSYLELAEVEPSRRVNLEARLRALEQAAAAQPPPEPTSEQPKELAQAQPAPDPALEAAADEADMAAILPYALIGVGGAMVIGGVVTGLMTQSKIDEVEDGCPDEMCPAGFGLEGRVDDIDKLALVTDVLLFGGVAVAGVGAVLLILDDGEQAPAAAPAASLGCGPSGCMASVRGRF